MRCMRPRKAAIAAFLAGTAGLVISAGLGGCASPGSPRPPSLHLPAPVTDLTAARVGDQIKLRFTAPTRSTDGLPLRDTTLRSALCREVGRNPCQPVPGAQTSTVAGEQVTWKDDLMPFLRSGPPRPIAYRVETFNSAGRAAGYSEPVYALAGTAAPIVQDLKVNGSRLGIVLQWRADPASSAEVLLRREDLAAPLAPSRETAVDHAVRGRAAEAKPHGGTADIGHMAGAERRHSETPAVVWLAASPSTTGTGVAVTRTLDATAVRNTPYRYTAVRRLVVHEGGRTLEMRSIDSAPVEITLKAIYPPEVPTGLTAVGFLTDTVNQPVEKDHGAFAVDLIWQPVEDSDLAGYNVYRQQLAANSAPISEPTRLNSTPVLQSAFHDTSASAMGRYRYSVTAVDTEGNESAGASTTLEPSTQP